MTLLTKIITLVELLILISKDSCLAPSGLAHDSSTESGKERDKLAETLKSLSSSQVERSSSGALRKDKKRGLDDSFTNPDKKLGPCFQLARLEALRMTKVFEIRRAYFRIRLGGGMIKSPLLGFSKSSCG